MCLEGDGRREDLGKLWILFLAISLSLDVVLVLYLRGNGRVNKTRQVSLLLVCYNLLILIFVCVLNEKMNLGVFACFSLVIGRLQLRTIAFADPLETTMSAPGYFLCDELVQPNVS